MAFEVTIRTESTEETKALGRFIGAHAGNDLFLALIGDLGTGKTHFVQGLAEGMGITDPVTSPTFNIMNLYEGTLPLKHFDFYRLNDAFDLYNIGWDEYSVGGVTVAEWADLFPALIPAEAFIVHFTRISETEREITVTWKDSVPALLGKEIETYALSH